MRKSDTTFIASTSAKADGFLEPLLPGYLWILHARV